MSSFRFLNIFKSVFIVINNKISLESNFIDN